MPFLTLKLVSEQTAANHILVELACCILLNVNYIGYSNHYPKLNDEYIGFKPIQEFPRMLRDLIRAWKRCGFNYRYNINWKKFLSLIR